MSIEHPQSDANHPAPGVSVESHQDALAQQDELSLLDLLIILAAHKRRLLALTAAFALVSIIVSLILPKKYEATVTLLPPPQQQNSSMNATLAGGLSAFALLGGFALENPNDRYVGMLKSHSVEDAMVDRFELMREYRSRTLSSARDTLENNAKIKDDTKDGLIRVSVDDRDPRRAAELANGWAAQLQTLTDRLATDDATTRRALFDRELRQAKQDLADTEQKLMETEQSSGVIQLNTQTNTLIQASSALAAQIAAAQIEEQGMNTYAGSENPELIRLQEQLAGLRAQQARLGGSGDLSDAGLLLPRGQVPSASLAYLRRERDLRFDETVFDILARQFEAAKLDQERGGALFRIVDPAVPPERKIYPVRSFIVLAGTATGFFVAALITLLKYAFMMARRDPEIRARLALLRQQLNWRLTGSKASAAH